MLTALLLFGLFSNGLHQYLLSPSTCHAPVVFLPVVCLHSGPGSWWMFNWWPWRKVVLKDEFIVAQKAKIQPQWFFFQMQIFCKVFGLVFVGSCSVLTARVMYTSQIQAWVATFIVTRSPLIFFAVLGYLNSYLWISPHIKTAEQCSAGSSHSQDGLAKLWITA